MASCQNVNSSAIAISIERFDELLESRIKDIEDALQRVTKVARILFVLFRVGFIGCAVISICSLALLLFQAIRQDAVFPNTSQQVISLIGFFAHGTLIAILFFLASKVFKDISKGSSPFLVLQANRVRVIAVVFLIYALFDFVWSPELLPLFVFGQASLGIWTASEPMILHVNVGVLAAAVVFFCLSLVFQYGSLLQRLSDDTI